MNFLNKNKDKFEKINNLFNIINNNYQEINKLYQNIDREKFIDNEIFKDANNNLDLIKEKVIENKLYKTMSNGSFEEQIRKLENEIIVLATPDHRFYEHTDYTLVCRDLAVKDLEPLEDKKGNQMLLTKEKIKKKNYIINKQFSITSFKTDKNEKVYLYKLPEYINEDKIKDLKAYSLLIDDSKLNLIEIDLEEKLSLLNKTQEELELLLSKNSLEEVDDIGERMISLASDLP